MKMIRSVLESIRAGRPLESFPVNFGQFLAILCFDEKNFIFGLGQFRLCRETFESSECFWSD